MVLRSNLSNVQTFTARNEIFCFGTNSAWSDNFIIYIAGVPYYRRAEAGISCIKVASRPFFAVHTIQLKLFLIWPSILYITSDFSSVLDLWKQELCLCWVFSSGTASVSSVWSQSPTYALTICVRNAVPCFLGLFAFSYHFQKPSSRLVEECCQWFHVFSTCACDWLREVGQVSQALDVGRVSKNYFWKIFFKSSCIQ